MRPLITEADVTEARRRGESLVVPANALVTPSARDEAHRTGVALITPGTSEAGGRPALNAEALCRVAIGADHGGFDLKESIRTALVSFGYTVEDCGTHSRDAVDYPDLAHAVARAVSEGRSDRGVVIDGAGVGSSIAANKVPGIRAACCHDLFTIRNSREHNNANVLSLGSKGLSAPEAIELVRVWLTTPFAGGRHARRIEKISAMEYRYLR